MLDDSLFGMMGDSGRPGMDSNEDNDGDAVEAPDVLAEVKLAQTPGTFTSYLHDCLLSDLNF